MSMSFLRLSEESLIYYYVILLSLFASPDSSQSEEYKPYGKQVSFIPYQSLLCDASSCSNYGCDNC